MIFYTVGILGSDLLIILINLLLNKHFFNFSNWYIIVSGFLAMIAVIAVDGLFAFIIRRFPEKWFDYKTNKYLISKKTRKIYEALGIKNWKDKVLELGMFTNFSKSKIAKPDSLEYVERYILEARYGIAIHDFIIFAGFLIIFFWPLKYAFCFAVPVAVVNAFFNVLPSLILRYNLPRLVIMHKRLSRDSAE